MKPIEKKEIKLLFRSYSRRVLLKSDIMRIIAKSSIGNSYSRNNIIGKLKEIKLKEIVLSSPNYEKEYTRFTWGNHFSYYQISLSLKLHSYLCHQTAMYLHGLTDKKPKMIYVNSEQSAKGKKDTKLEQGRVDMAFTGSPRTSKYIFDCNDRQICILSGVNTRNIGVEEKELEKEGKIQLTSLERTLIDITVRPIYAGGCKEVLAAYKKAKGRISINTLIEILRKINYTYPYHQAIGFYLEAAGYNKEELYKLKEFGLNIDFYLDYKIEIKKYSDQWRIYYPNYLLI